MTGRILPREAWLLWTALWAGAATGLLFMFAPVLLAGTPLEWMGDCLFSAYAPFCHQEADRSFHVRGVQLVACSRCVALYAGTLLGVTIAPALGIVGRTRLLPRWVLAAGLLPLVVDALAGLWGLGDSSFASRTATGILAGAAGSLFVLPAAAGAFRDIRAKLFHKEVLACHPE